MKQISLTNDKINCQGGLGLVGKLVKRFASFGKKTSYDTSRSDRISDEDILKSQIGLLVQARPHFDDIELFRSEGNEGFAANLQLDNIPSGSTLRQRIGELAKGRTSDQLVSENFGLIKSHKVSPVKIGQRNYIPVDIDVSPFDNGGSHRENVERTYKGCDGFAPIFGYLGMEGWILGHELRPGSQHCQKGTPKFLRRIIADINRFDFRELVMFRMDAGNDSADTLEILRNSGHSFIIKRNQRKENPVKWLSHAMAQGVPEIPREGKEVYTGTAEHIRPGGESSTQDPLTVIYKVTKRSIDKHGQPLLIDDIEVETYWTNTGESAEDVIEGYHDHGTSEQFHSEIKTDLNLERFPSNSYATNGLFLALGCFAYNLLRVVEQLALQHHDLWPLYLRKRTINQKRRRVGSTIRDLICVAGKLVKHAGKSVTKIARSWPWSAVILEVDAQLGT